MSRPNYWAFFDGSGKVGHTPVLSSAGYLGEAEDVHRFAEQWNLLLKKHAIGWLSMKESKAFEGPFAAKRQEWKTDDPRELQEKLWLLWADFANLIKHSQIVGFGYAVPSEWIRDRQVQKSELFLFTRVLQLIIQVTPPDAALMIMSDFEESFGEQLFTFFRKLRLDPKTREAANRIKSICVGDDKAIQMLQAADMLAYALNARVLYPAEPNPIYDLLSKNTPTDSKHYGEVFEPDEFKRIAGLA